jgi:hypothetical protein
MIVSIEEQEIYLVLKGWLRYSPDIDDENYHFWTKDFIGIPYVLYTDIAYKFENDEINCAGIIRLFLDKKIKLVW